MAELGDAKLANGEPQVYTVSQWSLHFSLFHQVVNNFSSL